MDTLLSWLANNPYAYHVTGFLLLLTGIAFLFFRILKSDNKSIADYILLWPLVIEQHKKTATKNSNKFVAWGLLVMVMLVLGSVVFLN
ncbi:hypothetical protein ACO0LF_27805 [Undibacterium sp. Di27W]|uniref:hypothetical protein n=1 Tax=Undibacterium sp. Di27W TaxID=3413036 RepID=UPI003BF0356A